jgi:hypothetical protein
MKRFFVALLFLFLASRLFSMDWPSPAGVMQRNFGINEGGMPYLGISFASTEPLAAADDGELLYQRRESDTASRLPSPLGSWMALDHGDGIISIYSRLDDSSFVQSANPGYLEKGSILGESGISGWSSQRGFFFQLYDRKERRWINPALIIPVEDYRLPVIHSVRLMNADGRLFDPYLLERLPQGRYSVIVNANDTMRSPFEVPLAPFRIICTMNGSEAGVLNFENYSARNGVLVVYRNGLIPVRQVYAHFPAYEVADLWFTRGQTSLEIIAQDIAGNSRRVFYRFLVE